MDEAVGSPRTVSGVPVTAATLLPFVNVSCTDEAPVDVPDAMIMVTVVVLTHAGDAAKVLPLNGDTPTLAVKPAMKFEPPTVMVLPM